MSGHVTAFLRLSGGEAPTEAILLKASGVASVSELDHLPLSAITIHDALGLAYESPPQFSFSACVEPPRISRSARYVRTAMVAGAV
jgi:hypothetical protein